MNIYKVLDILNNGEYVKIEESHTSSDSCPYSESSYTVTLKEGGMIRITQVKVLGVSYRISLFVPNEEKSVESWSFSTHRKGWLHPKTIKDPLYDEVSLTFYNLYYECSKKKLDERSKYFPQ
jgi:hypothetical protein